MCSTEIRSSQAGPHEQHSSFVWLLMAMPCVAALTGRERGPGREGGGRGMRIVDVPRLSYSHTQCRFRVKALNPRATPFFSPGR